MRQFKVVLQKYCNRLWRRLWVSELSVSEQIASGYWVHVRWKMVSRCNLSHLSRPCIRHPDNNSLIVKEHRKKSPVHSEGVFQINHRNILTLPSFIAGPCVTMLRVSIWGKERWVTLPHMRKWQYVCHRANTISLYSIHELQVQSEGIVIALHYTHTHTHTYK